MKDIHESLIEVGKLGRSVGLKGGLKFHIATDFPEIFKPSLKLFLQSQSRFEKELLELNVKMFDFKNSIIFFENIDNVSQAKNLINHTVFCTLEDTRRFCVLKNNEFFWFDLLGLKIFEENQFLGVVENIDRIGNIDYLIISTDLSLRDRFSKIFMIPYIDRFIINVSLEQKTIFTQGAKFILEES